MNAADTKKQVRALTLLFTVTYMVSYITRINYGAVISEMVVATGLPKSVLGISLTGSFITYGAGQLVSGVCGDYVSPKKLISIGLFFSSAMNLLIPICPGPYFMLAVWCVNGFAQSFMWPPLVKLMTGLLSMDDYRKCSAKVSWGSSAGTMVLYLVSPVIITLSSWKWVFVFSAVCGIVMLFFWNKYAVSLPPENKTVQTDKPGAGAKLFTPLLIGILAGAALQGMLKDGVTTWMPSYISETYNLSSAAAILTGIALPVFSIICVQAASVLYKKVFTNPMLCAAVLFGAGAGAAFLLCMLSESKAVFSVLFSALLTGCMHGVNFMLIHIVPAYFKGSGKVSTVSGIINGSVYVGSAASTYGIALLSENFGWNYTIMVWTAIAAAGGVLCLVCMGAWKRMTEKSK